MDEQRRTVKFSLLDVSIALVLLLFLLMALLPNVHRPHSAAKRTQCTNNLRQIALAIQNYQSSHLCYPPAMGWYPDGEDGHLSGQWSGLVHLLSEIEENVLYEAVFDAANDLPPPTDPEFNVWQAKIDIFRCPSAPAGKSEFAQTNYAFCVGDVARNIHQPTKIRGAFACGFRTDASQIKDGTSNTILLAEMGTSTERHLVSQFAKQQMQRILDNPALVLNLGDASNPQYYRENANLHEPGRGACWANGAAGYGIVNTILPPNRPSASVAGLAADGIYTAGSFHRGGCIVSLADGSTRFVADTIDAGDANSASPTGEQLQQPSFTSPYGVWGALGTANASEPMKDLEW